MRIEDFVFPYGQLDKNNEWVKLAASTPKEDQTIATLSRANLELASAAMG